jgi:hypothetical protein
MSLSDGRGDGGPLTGLLMYISTTMTGSLVRDLRRISNSKIVDVFSNLSDWLCRHAPSIGRS